MEVHNLGICNLTTGNCSEGPSSTRSSDGLHQKVLWLQAPIGVIIVTLNIMTIYVLWKTRMRQNNLRILFINMAISDFAVGLLFTFNCFVFYAQDRLTAFACGVRFGGFLCFMMVSIGNILFLTLDRCCTLTFPFQYPYVMTERRTIALSAILWVFSVVVIYLSFYWALRNFTVCRGLEMMSNHPEILAPVLAILVVVLVALIAIYGIIFSHARIQLRKIIRDMGAVPQFVAPARTDVTTDYDDEINQHYRPRRKIAGPMRKPRMRHLKTVSILLGVLLACYLPFTGVLIYAVVTPNAWRTFGMDIASNCVGFLMVINSFINPLLYTWKTTELRLTFLKLFCTCSKYCQSKIQTLRNELI